MVKKRISMAVVILMLIVQFSYGLGFTTQVKAASIESDRDIITSVSMAVYGADGQTVTDNVYEVGSNVRLDYTWSLPNGHGYKDGDTFTFQVPAQFQLFNDISGPLVSDDGEVGSFSVSQSTHQVVMTFNSYIETHDNVQGTLSINTKFDKQVITGSTVQEIKFPVGGGIQTVTVIFKPDVGSTIEKKGVSSGFNADSIQWTVDVNKKLEHVANAVVTDPIPTGLSLDSTVTLVVYQLGVQLDGTVTVGAPLDSSKYTADVSGGKLTVNFTDPVINGAYRIAYTTPIVDDSQVNFTNRASFAGDGRDPASSSATVTVERGGSLKKMATAYDWGSQTVFWAIEYNYNNKKIPQGSAVLKDLFDDSQRLVTGSVEVYPVTLDAAGTATKGTPLVKNVDYTITGLGIVGKNGFKLEFTGDVSSAYRIEYQTQSQSRVYQDTTITNTVSDSTYSAEAKQLIRPVIIYKTLSGTDYKNKTAVWKITVNGDNYPMREVAITDTFPQGGLKFVPGTLVVRDPLGTVVKPSAYTLEYSTPVQPNAGFKLKFASPIKDTYTITYTTQFSNDWLNGNTDNFVNNARVDWKDIEGPPRWTEAKGLFIPRSEMKNNGFKSGSYNASAKEITWTVGVNYNSKEIADPSVTDVLNSGQFLVPGSLKVYNMNVNAKGDPSQGSEVSSSAFSYSVSGNELKVVFAGPISSPYYIVFKTSLEGQLVDSSVYNTAKLLDGTKKVSKDLTASVSIPHGDEYVYKEGQQNGDKLDWKITINRTQSYVKNAVLTDTPSSNQILLPDSFHLYPAAAAANGEVTKSGTELVKDADYTLNVRTDDAGKQYFVLSFLHDINSAYVLDYQSLIVANTGDKLINTVLFTGTNVTQVTKVTTKEVIVGVSSGSGTGSGVRGTLTVQKLDAANNQLALSGATFEVYRLSGAERVLVNTRTTDAAGNAVFNNLWLGNYILIEKTAPEGYALDSKEYPVTIGSSANINLTVLNTKLATPTPTPTPTPSSEATATPSASPVVSDTPGTPATPSPAPTPVSPVSTVAPTPGPSQIPGVIINDDPVPAGAVQTATPTVSPTAPVNSAAPDEETTIDDNVPLGSVEVNDDEVPRGSVTKPSSSGKLPQTGESSPMPIYLAGLGLILVGFILSRVFKRSKE